MANKIGQIINSFFKSVIFKNFMIAGVLIIVLFFGSFWILKIFTQHGETISVPDFTGLKIGEVDKLCKQKNLNFVIVDSIYNVEGARGTIVEQNPPVDFKVKEGRKIFLTLKANAPEQVVMPSVVNISLQQAKAELINYGLYVNKITYEIGRFENVVQEQKMDGKIIEPGTRVEKGSPVELILESGVNNKRTFPLDLNGLTLLEAYNKNTDALLNIGNVYYDETVQTSHDSITAMVWKQEPDITMKGDMQMGSNIDVWLTKNRVKVIANSERAKDENVENKEE